MRVHCLLVASLLLLTACGRGAAPTNPRHDTPPAADLGRFSLSLLPADPALGRAEVTLHPQALPGGGVLVRVEAANARQLKGLFYELAYDAKRYTPTAALFTNTLAPTDQLLTLSCLDEPGTLQQGAVITAVPGAKGFDGSGVLAEVRFAAQPMAPARSASKAPKSPRSQATLNLDQDSLTLSWGYASEGDYDQNSEVNAADLAPLGFNFRQKTAGGPFPPGSKLFMIDGDQNGELNASDISPIGTNFKRTAASYNVYQSTSAADIPAGTAPSTITPLGFVNIDDGVAAAAGEQKRFSFTVPELRSGWFYWVRPADAPDGGGEEGLPSNVVSFGGKPGNLPPVVSVNADPTAGNAPLTVNFDASASSDPDGSIIQFAWDFDGNGTIDTTTTAPTVSHLYQAGGVFQAAVQVTDDGADTASASVTVTVTDAGNLPPVAHLVLPLNNVDAPAEISYDASTSTDADGTLVNFEWDFDGDGTFDAVTGTEPSALHFFKTGGSFTPKVRVTDNLGASSTATATLTLGTSNQLPTARIQDITTGDSDEFVRTLTAADSSDPDGTIVNFQWDIDDDGVIDANTANVPTLTITFQTPGLFTSRVIVTDNSGGTAENSTRVGITVGGKLRARINLTATPDHGEAPTQVTFNIEIIEEGNRPIETFDWDFDFDGVKDLTTTEPTAQFTYTSDGMKEATVRGFNADGLVGSDSVRIAIGKQLPIARIVATPKLGTDPHLVHLDASTSVDLDGGPITKFEWDLDGNGSLETDTGSNPQTSITFTTAGEHVIDVKVTDDESQSNFGEIRVTTLDPDNNPPSAALAVSPKTGAAPLDVTFDASGSSDDSAIQSFGWDFTGDGIIDRVTATPTTTVRLATKGQFAPVVHVIDDDGASTTATDSLELTSGWTRTLIEAARVDQDYNLVVSGAGSLARARIGYLKGGLGSDLRFANTASAAGTAWEPLVNVNNVPGVQRESASLRIISGRPALAYVENGKVFYVRALDVSGSTWPAPVLVDGTGTNSLSQLVVAGGSPAIAYAERVGGGPGKLLIIRSTDTVGTAWPTSSVTIHTGSLSSTATPQFLTVGGKLVTIYSTVIAGATELQLRSAADTAATSWSAPTTVNVPSAAVFGLSCALVNGNPACAFAVNSGFNNLEMLYLRADDSAGGSWPGSPVFLAGQLRDATRSPALIVSGGLPGVVFADTSKGQVLFVRGQDASGVNWSQPEVVDFSSTFGASTPRATVLDGAPLLTYVDRFAEGGDKLFSLREQ